MRDPITHRRRQCTTMQLRRPPVPSVPAAVLLLLLAASLLSPAAAAAEQPQQAPLGAYLGCFNASRLGLEQAQYAKFSQDSISKCASWCGRRRHILHIVGTSYECWCSSLIPDADAQLRGTACSRRGRGVAVFYRHKDAHLQRCRLAPLALSPSSFDVHYNAHNLHFGTDSEGRRAMELHQVGTDGIRLAAADGKHLYGAYQVTAKVAGAPGVVTAFYVRSTDTYTLANDEGSWSEIDIEWLNGSPAPQHSLWLNSFKRGMSNGETMVTPADYQKLLGLPPNSTSSNAWLTYTFSWQPDAVVWSLNGTPLQRRYYDQEVTWTEMDGRTYTRRYRPPDAASHVTISMWSDANQTRAFGGQLDTSERGRTYISQFRGLRRILCDERLSEPSELGPSWLFSPSAAEGVAAPPPGLADLAGVGGRTLVTSVAGRPGYCLALLRNPDEQSTRRDTSKSTALLSVYACSSASPLWAFDEAMQVLRVAGVGCLADEAGQPVVAKCSSEGTPTQQWSLEHGGRLRSKSGLCVGVGGSAVKPHLTGVACGTPKELSWKPGVANLLLYLKPAKPIVTSNPAIGHCLQPAAGTEAAKPSELQPGPVSVAPCQAYNHAFYYQPASKQLIRKDTKLCLTADTSVSLQPCLASAFAAAAHQQWQLTSTGNLRTASDVCIGLQQSGGVIVVKCGTDEARWAFGGGNPLEAVNPSKALTTTIRSEDGLQAAVMDVVLEATQNGTTQHFLGLRHGHDSGLAFTFIASTGVLSVAGSGDRAGLCLTSRDDVQAVVLAECDTSRSMHSKVQQSWLWFAGQLKAAGAAGKCIGQAAPSASSGENAAGAAGHELRLLTLVPCTGGAPEAVLLWGFNGQLPGATAKAV